MVEAFAGEITIRRGASHFLVERFWLKGRRTSHAQHMLGQHVQRARFRRRGVLGALRRRLQRRLTFHDFELVGRHKQRLARLIEPMVGAAYALGQPAGALGRTHIDDEIDVAPIDAEIERRGADNRAELARDHRCLDFSALAHIEGTVMQRDGEVVVIAAPQLMKQHLSLGACIHEHQR